MSAADGGTLQPEFCANSFQVMSDEKNENETEVRIRKTGIKGESFYFRFVKGFQVIFFFLYILKFLICG